MRRSSCMSVRRAEEQRDQERTIWRKGLREEAADAGGEDHGRIWGIGIGIWGQVVSPTDSHENSASHKIRERPSARITYRLRGSLVLRDLACATGSKDFAASSDTGVVKEDAVSSSSERRLAGASSEALRRPRKAWRRFEGMNARGNARARYLDCSLAVIMCKEW
jgi:hypothetical protein